MIILGVVAFCAIALMFAQGGFFPQAFVGSSLFKLLGDYCLYVSLPGVIASFAIRGFYASGTIWSDLLIVAVNAILYSILVTLIIEGVRRWRSNRKSR